LVSSPYLPKLTRSPVEHEHKIIAALTAVLHGLHADLGCQRFSDVSLFFLNSRIPTEFPSIFADFSGHRISACLAWNQRWIFCEGLSLALRRPPKYSDRCRGYEKLCFRRFHAAALEWGSDFTVAEIEIFEVLGCCDCRQA
jgi:hypothetical protein